MGIERSNNTNMKVEMGTKKSNSAKYRKCLEKSTEKWNSIKFKRKVKQCEISKICEKGPEKIEIDTEKVEMGMEK